MNFVRLQGCWGVAIENVKKLSRLCTSKPVPDPDFKNDITRTSYVCRMLVWFTRFWGVWAIIFCMLLGRT